MMAVVVLLLIRNTEIEHGEEVDVVVVGRSCGEITEVAAVNPMTDALGAADGTVNGILLQQPNFTIRLSSRTKRNQKAFGSEIILVNKLAFQINNKNERPRGSLVS